MSKQRHNNRLKTQNQQRFARWYAIPPDAKLFIRQLSPHWQACIPLSTLILLAWGCAAVAQDSAPTGPTLAELKVGLDTMWVTIAAMLVFFMNAGFCMLETGLCRQKNAVNLLAKNLIVFALATLAYWVVGFGLMYGDGTPFFGTSGFLLMGADNSPATGAAYNGVYHALNWTGVPLAAKFFFQLAFAGTAATIVSGSVAERIKFIDFLIFSLLLVAFSYSVTGHWIWGKGWLSHAYQNLPEVNGFLKTGFWDFAGSTVVHSVGGWAALIGAALLGPRLGKYIDRQPTAMPGHNMSIATLGCLILWFGWFGFNPGSTMAVTWQISHIAVNTNMAAAMGGIAATIVSWAYLGKPDLTMIINGILAGLVAVTGSCAFINIGSAASIGAIGGVLVVFAVTFFERVQIDDPVGAISVHLVNGIWGTLAVGLFALGPGAKIGERVLYVEGAGPAAGLFFGGGIAQLLAQAFGILSVAGFTVALSTAFWLALKKTLGLRVPEQEEKQGLDIGEHGMEAYSGFVKDTRGIAGGP